MIPALFCNLRNICNHVFDVTSSPCFNSTNISITVFASNTLGDGPPSDPYFAIIKNQSEYDHDNGKLIDLTWKLYYVYNYYYVFFNSYR